MLHVSNVELALAALVVEAAIGYPAFVYRAIRHPVIWMGALVAGLDARLNGPNRGHVWGVLALVILLLATAGATEALRNIFFWVGPVGVALQILAATSLIAQNSLR